MAVLEEVALQAFALSNSHQVFKCFPGEGYKFYDVVAKENVIFLDVRGLDGLPDNPAAWSRDELLLATTADYLSRHGTTTRTSRRRSRRRSGVPQRNANFVHGLLLDAKKGDLVVVPPPGWKRDVLIGEITDDPGTPIRVTATDDDQSFIYLGRAVKWRTKVEKRFLKRELLDKLQTPQAFFLVGKDLHDDIYALAYENYVWDGRFVATFHTTKDQFTSADSLTTSVWFNGMAAARAASERETAIAEATFAEAALQAAQCGAENELQLNINSPGTILVRSSGAFALALMAILPLNASEAQSIADGKARVTLQAVGNADPSCQLEVEAAVADYVRSLGPERLLQACTFAERARDDATLKAKAHVRRKRTIRLKRTSKRTS